MNAERYQQVKQIFLAACDLEPDRVAAFLDQACANTPELRPEVESLLQHHTSATATTHVSGEGGGRLSRFAFLANAGGDSCDPAGSERFAPGRILAGRYRILGSLGQGGMGDVYRADDLKLGQAVALKFLARYRSAAPSWLARYRNEVRLARKVTHVNVLRVYDIGEAEGEVFISMEYVDGEDLGSLLRRVGRLTGEKAIQIARQLCAGLGAAHDRGVLHRDLKPANIMIDGQGQVRIADFGIASPVTQAESTSALIGTPAYMAPELFTGGNPSVRSDLFSLGVVLYEVLTGKPPFEGPSAHSAEHGTTVIRPTATVSDVEPVLEQVILKCLEHDPKRRPASAYEVAAALPGADLFAQAIAAGVTPSPSMVAAAEARWTLPAWAAMACLATAVVALLFIVRLADRSFLLPQAGLVKPPAVLVDRAEELIAALGNEPGNQEHWQGFSIDRGFLEYAMSSAEARPMATSLARVRPPAVCFWYHVGSKSLALPTLLNESLPIRWLPTRFGAITVRLDGQGRLVEYRSTQASSPPLGTSSPRDWSALFEWAGLQMSAFRPVPPSRTPPMYVDALMAWEGACPESPEVPLHVEGGMSGGRVMFFKLTPPWEQDQEQGVEDEAPTRLHWRLPLVRWLLYLLGMIGGGWLAWHNIELGRGDLRGASKLAAFIMLVGLLDWLIGESHVTKFVEEVGSLYLWTARAALTAAIGWICYVAVEPYVRRFWPDVMITWTRLLQGRFGDPLVGRDVLIGGTAGVLMVLLMQLDILFPTWLGWPSPIPKLPGPIHDVGAVLGLRYKLSIMVVAMMGSVTLGLLVLLLMLALRAMLRPARLAMAVSWLLLTVLQVAAAGCDVSFPWLVGSVGAGVVILLFTRVGLVAMIASLFFSTLLVNSPLTSDLRAWYAPSSTLAVSLTVAVLAYGVLTLGAGRSIARSLMFFSRPKP